MLHSREHCRGRGLPVARALGSPGLMPGRQADPSSVVEASPTEMGWGCTTESPANGLGSSWLGLAEAEPETKISN